MQRNKHVPLEPRFNISEFYCSSPDPDASKVPSLLNATELTQFECPFRVATSVLDSTFQSFIVLSRDPDASKVPSLLNATELTYLNALLE